MIGIMHYVVYALNELLQTKKKKEGRRAIIWWKCWPKLHHCDPTHIHGLFEIYGSMTYNNFTEQGNNHFRRRDPCKEI